MIQFKVKKEDIPLLIQALKMAHLPIKNKLWYLTKQLEHGK